MYRDSLRITSGVLAAGALSVTVACGAKVVPPAPAPPPPPAVVAAPPPQAPPPMTMRPPVVVPQAAPVPTEDEVFASWTLDALNQQKPLDTVLFAYDSADLSDAGKASLQKNSAWLMRWTSTRVTVEGHADSRGTNEYNLALGERRAASVRDYLVGLGVATARVSIVSKGEEQPTCMDETETCFQQNRRGQFVITAK
ncbi:MAG: peptidoglycan-associated lipoprotein [Acidobacteria bacterium]|nr:peptidoglycan-associated lipoprotein [Acidobacteriota bacterium]